MFKSEIMSLFISDKERWTPQECLDYCKIMHNALIVSLHAVFSMASQPEVAKRTLESTFEQIRFRMPGEPLNKDTAIVIATDHQVQSLVMAYFRRMLFGEIFLLLVSVIERDFRNIDKEAKRRLTHSGIWRMAKCIRNIAGHNDFSQRSFDECFGKKDELQHGDIIVRRTDFVRDPLIAAKLMPGGKIWKIAEVLVEEFEKAVGSR